MISDHTWYASRNSVMAKAASGWVSSTFGSFSNSSASTQKNSQERKRKGTTNIKIPAGEIAWIDKYHPKEKDDLAVHKRKVEQVEEWVKLAISAVHKKKNKCPLLLLTGPTGSGKTATVRVLAAQLGLVISEWKNSTQYVAYREQTDYENVFEEQQIPNFKSFLLRASRYSSIVGEQGSGRLVLVEDFPNACFRDPDSFQTVLRQYVHVGQSPTVFIISDSSRKEISSNKLFSKNIMHELGVHEISFNPLTNLTISRVFVKILSAEKATSGNQIRFIPKQELDSLAEASAGDIRSAINSLQFAASSNIQIRKAPKKAKNSESFKKPSEPQETSCALGRDSTLVLFHALGKILYCKRDSTKEEPLLPKRLQKYQRHPTKENPEMVVERASTSSQNFNLFLHQNYLEFFHDTDQLSKASEYMSTADCLHPGFEDQSRENEYGSSVGVRGLMLHLGNENTGNSKGKWMPIRKPAWYDVNRIHQKNLIASREEFKESLLNMGQELYVTGIPFMSKISSSSLTPGQKHLVLSLARFPKKNDFRFSDGMEEEEDSFQACTYNYLSSEVSQLPENEIEDDVNIEEFSE